MILILKNKKILFNEYKLKCAIGKRGTSKIKREGDNTTPIGKFRFLKVYYRADKIKKLNTKLKKIKILKNMGWCDDSRSKKYNRMIKFPFSYSAEYLYRKDSSYDIVVILDYNTKPIKKNRGSAIFIHIAKKNYKPTKGCVALSKKDMTFLLSKLKRNDQIRIF